MARGGHWLGAGGVSTLSTALDHLGFFWILGNSLIFKKNIIPESRFLGVLR